MWITFFSLSEIKFGRMNFIHYLCVANEQYDDKSGSILQATRYFLYLAKSYIFYIHLAKYVNNYVNNFFIVYLK